MGTHFNSTQISTPDFTILMPCRNMAPSIHSFLRQLELTLKNIDHRFLVLLIDDASSDDTVALIQDFKFTTPNIALQVLPLPCRLGQETAIAEGLSLAGQLECEYFILMEANGMDSPEAITELIKVQQKDVVLVDKGPKTGHLLFWFIYRVYQVFFRFLTSQEMHLGHYSMINRKALQLMIQIPFFHYTTALCRKSLKLGSIRSEQKMHGFKQEFRNLMQHGIRSFMEFGEDLLQVFLKLSLGLGFLLFASGLTILYFKYFTDTGLPGWTIFALIGLFNGLILSIGFFSLSIMVLNRLKSSVPEHSATSSPTRPVHQINIPFHEPISLN